MATTTAPPTRIWRPIRQVIFSAAHHRREEPEVGTRFITRTKDLPPYSIGGVTRAGADGAGRFAVVYLVDENQLTSCAAGEDAGTDAYVYPWTGHRMVRQSGVLPRLPEVILGTGVQGPWPR